MSITTDIFDFDDINKKSYPNKDVLDYFKRYFKENISNNSLAYIKISNPKYGTIYCSKTTHKNISIKFIYTENITPRDNTNQSKARTFKIIKLKIY